MAVRIEGFDHRPGAHCGSTSLRNLADYYGWGFDEPACFGLASGVGFTYVESDERPWRAFFGRPMWLEVAFFEHLDVPHEHRAAGDWETAWRAVRRGVDGGDPVVLFVDLYYLDYYDTTTHFGPHSLLAVGYGDDHVLLSDSEFDEVQALALPKLREAMTSDHMPSRKNRYLVVDDPGPGASTAEAVRAAVGETTGYMLDPAGSDRRLGPGEHGIPGMRHMARDLPAWADLPDPSWASRFAYQNVDRRGTGGGAFRRLYAGFLDWAADHAPLPPDAGERMHGVAAAWSESVGEHLRRASEADGDDGLAAELGAASRALSDVADREEALYRDLR